jgi:homoserine acetyltransferase
LKIATHKQLMLLPFAQDALIPAHELIKFGEVLGSQKKDVHLETLSSIYGHDAFLKGESITSCVSSCIQC